MSYALSRYPVIQPNQGMTGDKKCNAVVVRVISGGLVFCSIMMSVIAVMVGSQPCCGPRWENDAEQYHEECTDRDLSDKMKEGDSDNNCYAITMVTIAIGVFAIVCLLTAFCLIVYAELTAERDEADVMIDAVRAHGERSRFEEVFRRHEDRELSKKKKKYEAKLEKKYSEMVEMQNRRNSFPGAVHPGKVVVHQPPSNWVHQPYAATPYSHQATMAYPGGAATPYGAPSPYYVQQPAYYGPGYSAEGDIAYKTQTQ